GRAFPGVELRVREEVLEVRSPTLLTAYHTGKGPELPVGADGFFRTNDLAALDPDGTLRILGRADDLIVTGGEKVNPLAVEAALVALPGVVAACVVGLPDPRWGQIVAAAVVAS